jgi:hypothetical protein
MKRNLIIVAIIVLGIVSLGLAYANSGEAAPPSTTTTAAPPYLSFTNDWNLINGSDNNMVGADLHWVLGGNNYQGPISLYVQYSDGTHATFAGTVHGSGSISADSAGKPGCYIAAASITYLRQSQSGHKLTISHVIGEETTTTTVPETTTTTEPETTTTTQPVTTTTSEGQTTTTTVPDTTTTTFEPELG